MIRVCKVSKDKKDTEVSLACQVSFRICSFTTKIELIPYPFETGPKGDIGPIGEQIQGPEGNKGYPGDDFNISSFKSVHMKKWNPNSSISNVRNVIH